MPRAISKGRMVDEEKLVNLIKRTPELYDSTHENASDAALKKTIWKNIAEDLDVPVDICKKVWNKLKDAHTKENKVKETKNRRKSLRSCSSEKNLGFNDVSSVDNSNDNSRASSNCGSPNGSEKRRLRSSSRSLSQLGTISETDLASLASSSADTIAPREKSASKSRTQSAGRTPRKILNFAAELQANGTNERYPMIPIPAERTLRSRLSEPSHLASKEVLQSAVNSTPRRQSGPGSNGRNNRMRKSPNPSDPTRAFFESMALTVSTFPQHLQAAMKVHICNLVSETEYDLSSPKIR